MHEFDPSVLFRVVDLLGVIANALIGGAVARARNFDAVGFVILAITCGLGGGMLRDVMLGVGFPVALTDPAYLAAAMAGAAVAYLLDLEGRWTRRALTVADALAVGCWSATGAAKALGVGLDWLPAIVLGVVTAVGGGMIRDVLINEVPAVFGGNPLYATLSAVGSAEMVLAQRLLGNPAVGMAASILTCGVLVVLARRRGWVLPGALRLSVPRPRLPRRRGRSARSAGRDPRREPPGRGLGHPADDT
ncbi:MAG: trimeric intracellular cation channel family protein [Actinomycetales bacterium]